MNGLNNINTCIYRTVSGTIIQENMMSDYLNNNSSDRHVYYKTYFLGELFLSEFNPLQTAFYFDITI